MTKATRIVAFFNQKGGTGKSTSAIHLSTAIWYDLYLKWDVALFDCDNPQYSASKLRDNDERDIANAIQLVQNGKLKSYTKYIDQLKKVLKERNTESVYPITQVVSGVENKTKGRGEFTFSSKKDNLTIKDALEESIGKFDIIILDLPGKIDSNEVFSFMPYIDYLMVPIGIDTKTIGAAIETIDYITSYANSQNIKPPFLENDRIFIYFPRYKKGSSLSRKQYIENKILSRFPKVNIFKNYIAQAMNMEEDPLKTILPLPGSVAVNEHFTKFYDEFMEKII